MAAPRYFVRWGWNVTDALRVLALAVLVLTLPSLADEELPDAATSSLFWTQEERIVGFRNFDALYDTRPIDHGTELLPLRQAPMDFSMLEYEVEGETYTLDDHLESHFVAGILVAKDDRILLERYRLGHDAETRWVSYSIAKSVTSMLVGAAIQDGYIASVDEQVTAYLPRLKGTAYDGATIRNLLQMASGVAWNESYTDPESDVAKAGAANGMVLVDYLGGLKREQNPGLGFNYNTGETNLVGSVLRAAIGNNASSYLEAKVWRPIMEHPATWSITENVELGGCCIHATLRDYARIGMFALSDGVLPDGTRVLPEGWMRDSTTPSTGYPGYGYLWWLLEGGAYAGIGIFGQLIWVSPTDQVVIVTHSAWPAATGDQLSAHRWALVEALHAHVAEAN